MATSTGKSEYYAGNPLNRVSYLRQSPAFLASCLSSSKAKILLYRGVAPLFNKPAADGAWSLHPVSWNDIKSHLGGDATELLKAAEGKDEKLLAAHPEDLKTREEKIKFYITQNNLIFLGLDERSAPEESKSLPISKPDSQSSLESHSPHGVPWWALDITNIPALQKAAKASGEGLEFNDLRLGMAVLAGEEASIAGEGRALLDWNQRNVYCQGCGRPMRSVWGGWKRICVPREGLDNAPPCPSKGRGVQNYNYPRTDPVVIMGITQKNANGEESILLGRQKVWPKGVYSCLAGFLEYGESIEESVRREVYEEAGIVVDDVYYHSSQPWPYPSSLMIGALGVAKEGQTIRLDLDNELEDARFFTRAEVLAVLDKQEAPLSKEELMRFDQASEQRDKEHEKTEEKPKFRMPTSTAIAHSLVEAFAKNTYLRPASSGKL